MKYQDLIKQIKQKKFSPIYYFTGPEKTIAQMMEKRLVAAAVPAGMEQLNVMTFKENLTDAAEVTDIARQLPLMSPYRVVILREETGIGHTADAQIVDAFDSYLKSPEPTTIMIICDSKPDKRKKLYKALSKTAAVVDFEPLTLVELENWIAARFSRAGKKIGTRTLRIFIDKTRYLTSDDVNMAMIDNRTAQLIDYAGDAAVITREMIDAVVPAAADDNVFHMVDLAVQGRTGQALAMLKTLYLTGESPFGIAGLLAGQFRTMLMVRLLADERTPQNLIAKQVGRPGFVVKKMDQAGRRFGREKIMMLLKKCADLDYKTKTGQIDAEAGVEMFLMQI